MVVRQPNAPAAFTPGDIPGTHFQRLSRPQVTRFCRKEPPPGIDPGAVRLVAQRLNHYATPGPNKYDIRNSESSVAVARFLPGRAKDLSARLYNVGPGLSYE